MDYILSRGVRRLDALDLPSQFHRFAFSQDMIGWDNFMLRKVSLYLPPIQYSHLLCSPSMLTFDDWMKKFIDQLIHIVHGQWIYRNVYLSTMRYLAQSDGQSGDNCCLR
jgi:hypothetical protein